MFLQNKYRSTYFALIERARHRSLSDYSERHHVIPLSLGGQDVQDNIVRLTAREHYIAHLLLCRMTTGEERRSMIFAFSRMNGSSKTHKRHQPKSRWYEHCRKLLSEAMTERFVSEETRAKIGKIASSRSPESIQKMKDAKSKPCTIDGITIFPSKKSLGQTLGWGKSGALSPTFRYLTHDR